MTLQDLDPWQAFAFKKFQGGAATGGNVIHLVRDSRGIYR
jgi:hypothetical protein